MLVLGWCDCAVCVVCVARRRVRVVWCSLRSCAPGYMLCRLCSRCDVSVISRTKESYEARSTVRCPTLNMHLTEVSSARLRPDGRRASAPVSLTRVWWTGQRSFLLRTLCAQRVIPCGSYALQHSIPPTIAKLVQSGPEFSTLDMRNLSSHTADTVTVILRY